MFTGKVLVCGVNHPASCGSGTHVCKRRNGSGHTSDHKCNCGFRWQSEMTRQKQRDWRLANPEKEKEIKKRYNKKNQNANRDYARRIYQENPDKVRASAARYRKRHPENIKQRMKTWRQENLGHRRQYKKKYYHQHLTKSRLKVIEQQMIRRYGIDFSGYETLLARQSGKCKLCPKTEEENRKRLAIDHDHRCCSGKETCGKCIRGLLCSGCNAMVGQWEKAKREHGHEKMENYANSRTYSDSSAATSSSVGNPPVAFPPSSTKISFCPRPSRAN